MTGPGDTTPPAYIRSIDMATREVTMLPSASVPEDRRFVYRRAGRDVATAAEADEVIPVAEVRLTPLNAAGRLVPREHATRIRIEEVDAAGRVLRWTLMTKD